jgi:hypothetical protein
MAAAVQQQRISDLDITREDRIRLDLAYTVAPLRNAQSFLWFAAAALVAAIWYVLNS